MLAAAPVLPVGYVVSARRIADRRMILTGYRLADLLTREFTLWLKEKSVQSWQRRLGFCHHLITLSAL